MINRRRFTTALAAGVGSSIALPAFSQKSYSTGVSDTEIKIGNSAPYSGPVSAYSISGRTIHSYMKMLNDKGGINGRKISFITYDDEFSPPKTTEVVRRLVEQDEVFLVTGGMGSAANLAIQRYMNAKKVPQMFLAVGGSKFNDPKNSPWTLPFNPSYHGEGVLYAQHILKTRPDAKVGVLLQNDEMGKDLLKGFRDGMGDKVKMIVSEQSYEVTDPTIDSQVVQLKSAGVNVLVNLSLSRAAAQAIRKIDSLGWKLDAHYLIYNAASIKSTFEPAGLEQSKGIITSAFYKDPGQARWADDAANKEYKAFMAKYSPKDDPNHSTAAYGYCSAQALEYVLRQAGDNLTRENILKIATNFKDVNLSMMLPGLTLSNSPANYFPVSSLQMVQFDGKELKSMGEPVKLAA